MAVPHVLVEIRNIGPIQRADIPVRPLNVLVGANNSGKSVAAAAVHSVLGSTNFGFSGRVTARAYLGRRTREILEDIDLDELVGVASAVLEGTFEPDDLPIDLNRRLECALEEYMEAYPSFVLRNLETALGGSLDSIVRVKGGRRMPARIDVIHSDPHWRASIRLSRPDPTTIFDSDFSIAQLLSEGEPDAYSRQRTRLTRWSTNPELAFTFLLDLCLEPIFRGFPSGSYYLPAARSGIMQSHRVLASAVLQASSRAGLEEMRVPRMTGLTSDFISQLLTLGEFGHGAFGAQADLLEAKVLQGHVAVDASKPYPEISYESPALDIPVHRSSSMIAEMAPVVLYLRYVVRRGELLVIEEPEAHLHPESQVAFARTLLDLVDEDLFLLLTTHSDYFLRALNNGLRSRSLRQLHLFEDEATVTARMSERVTALLFEKKKVNSTEEFETVVTELGLSDEDGIPDYEFSRVAGELYEETLSIDERQMALEKDR